MDAQGRDHSRRSAAERLAVSEQTIDRLIRAGELTAYHVGRRVVIPGESVDALVTRLRSAGSSGTTSTEESQ